jgi:alpha-glucosidase (family GH31 glycosyl hydrolase)
MRVIALIAAVAGCSSSTSEPSFDVSSAGGLSVRVDEGRLVIAASDGRLLLDGLPPGEVSGEAPPLVGFAVRDIVTSYEMKFGSFKPSDDARGPWRVATKLALAEPGALALLDGDQPLATLRFGSSRAGHLRVATIAAGAGRRLSWGFRCNTDDHFAGFGAQTWDVDHRGQTVPTFVQEQGIGKSESDEYVGAWYLQGRRHSSHAPIPQYLARRGYVLAVKTPHRAQFAMCSESDAAVRIELELGATVHVFDGPTPAEALARAGEELGKPRMPPRLAFAPWLDAIKGSAEVRRVAKKLRDEKIPSSVIWTEDWRGGTQNGDAYPLKEEWEVDPTLYPDFTKLAGELHDGGFAFFVYFNPFVYLESKAHQEVKGKGWLVTRANGGEHVTAGAKLTDTAQLDVFHEGARKWAVDKMRAAIALGADGWMHDFAEWMPTDGNTAKGSGADLHNEYPVMWQQLAREAIDGVNDGKQRLFFARSGWFGTPALTDVFWAGDQRTTMDRDDGMPTVIPIGIGLGLCGISTYGHDIAGYNSVNNPGSTKEVFFRWTELGAWSPVMRTHHGLQVQKNWTWEKDAETIEHFRRYAELHVSLLPYFEGLARTASTTALPIWRGMFVHFPEDAAAWPITDQVMVGSHVLVAPVQKPGASSRSVYLPQGKWYPWSSGAATSGGASITAPAPLGEIPVFARAGALIPTYPPGVMTVTYASKGVPGPESVGDDRVLFAFLGDGGSFDEADGKLRYRLDKLGDGGGALTFRYGDQKLAACGAPVAAPCFDGETVHLVGPGVLAIDAGAPLARLTIEGGSSSRKLTVRMRR